MWEKFVAAFEKEIVLSILRSIKFKDIWKLYHSYIIIGLITLVFLVTFGLLIEWQEKKKIKQPKKQINKTDREVYTSENLCVVCGLPLIGRQKSYCSESCRNIRKSRNLQKFQEKADDQSAVKKTTQPMKPPRRRPKFQK